MVPSNSPPSAASPTPTREPVRRCARRATSGERAGGMRVQDWGLEPDELGPRRRPLVLLAEDDANMRRLIARALRQEDCEILEAADGAQLVRMLAIHVLDSSDDHPTVDLIISDVRMPGANGLDVLAALRRRDTTTPAILITAFGDPDTHLEAHRLGAVLVLNKPFEMDDLRVVVRSLIEPPT